VPPASPDGPLPPPSDGAAACGWGDLWFQLYVMKDRGVTEQMIRQAEELGYQAMVVTVDAPRLGRCRMGWDGGWLGLGGHPPRAHSQEALLAFLSPLTLLLYCLCAVPSPAALPSMHSLLVLLQRKALTRLLSELAILGCA
jgi:hypothetical protein